MTGRGRVVHVVCTTAFAGVERYVANVAPHLARRGWDVVVVGGDSVRMQEAIGEVPQVSFGSTLGVIAVLARFDRSTIVHTHMTAAEIAAAAARVARRFPIVTTRHFAARRGTNPVVRIAAPAILRSIAAQISVSDFVASAIGEASTTVHSAVADDALASGDGRTVLMVQRLEPEKRTADAVRAWAATALPEDGWRLLIAGDGSEHIQLTALSRELGVADTCQFLGPRNDVNELMSQASIFVATTSIEAFGLSVVEAMAAGLPVICARGGAHLETVGAVSSQWLFEPGDSAAIAKMLQSLATDRVERKRYGRALQQWQRSTLSIESHVDQLERIYARLQP